MDKRMEKLDSDIQEIYEYQTDPKIIQDKLTLLEDRSEQSNEKTDGIIETNGETWNDRKSLGCLHRNLDWVAQKLSVHIEYNNNKNNNTNRPQMIAVKLL